MTKLTWWFSGKPVTKEAVINCAPPGWHKIVGKLIDDLFAIGWDGQVAQVKEKFGGLRFYAGATSDDMNKLIRQAEDESYKTCDVCGEPGKPNESGWIATRCEQHAILRR